MSTQALESYLLEILNDHMEDGEIRDFETFEAKGLLTKNSGIVLKMQDRSEFQLQIVKSK
jgi:hypothetical protein